MPDDRAVDRVEKLLRLAAPSSGSTEHERASAALEAARLIEDYDLELRPRVSARRRHARDRQQEGERVNAWLLSVALDHVGCSACGGLISPRDVVWLRIREDHTPEYRHRYCGPF
jgi:hypothetical protein